MYEISLKYMIPLIGTYPIDINLRFYFVENINSMTITDENTLSV